MQDNEVTGQDDESDGDDVIENADEDEANPLVVPLAEAPKLSTDHLSKQWFSQDVFDGVGEGEELSDDEEAIAKMRKKRKAETDAEVDADGDEDMGVGASELPAANHSANGAASLAPAVGKGDFEIAPQEGNSSSDSDSDSEDDNGKAEILAYAKKMLKKKNRESILDDAYNRYTFNDEDMPRWFADDEKKHNRPEKPITKEEVEAMKVRTDQSVLFDLSLQFAALIGYPYCSRLLHALHWISRRPLKYLKNLEVFENLEHNSWFLKEH